MLDGITHSNKDVLFKVLSQNYENKSLAVYGLNLPKIKRLLPASYPAVTATETHADTSFLLEDDTLLLLEYESTVTANDFLKYADYVTNALKRLRQEGIETTKVVIAVVYTGDIKKAPAEFDVGALRVQVEQVFLSRFNTAGILSELKAKIETAEGLEDDDVMKLIILPLSQPDKKLKQELIEDAINLAKSMKDERQQLFAIAGIAIATSKFIDTDYLVKLKEWIKMTRIARLFEEEKIDAVNQAVSQNSREIARKMLLAGDDVIKVMLVTGLTQAEIDEIMILEVT